jgi:ABC-type sugar transport system substrate-binding protein
VTVGWDVVLGEAKAAGIPVVLVDRAVETGDASLYRSVLGSDYVAEGRKAGEWVVRTAGSGPVNIAELRGTAGSAVTDDRSRGFTGAIAGDSRLRIVAAESGDFTRSGGEERMRVMLAGYRIDVVFAHNDDMAIGALRAIETAGHTPGTDIRVVSVDGVRDAMTELVAGRMNYIVECSPLLGPQLMTLARRVHAGDPVPARVATEETAFDQNQARAALPDRRY